ncbi:hypothetical protein QN277_024170 [Acacia crassicarpa]|uniref:Uncharacterized protein n=1 Tax=Acacia crassicarpa TaxID=499986 RepID=A0AAE1MMT4_9FABA|nr:hypothetical protein QN277_024170 [Acacia crassicarpa]
MTMLSKDPAIKIPVSFDKGLQYAKSNSHYTKSESVRSILEPLADLGVSEAELCVIGNVCPQTSEEVFALIPSLMRPKVLTVEDKLMVLECRDLERRIVEAEMELTLAKSQGYLKGHPQQSGHKRLLAVIGVYIGFGSHLQRKKFRGSWRCPEVTP